MTINKTIAAINEACIGRLHENCYLVRGTFLVWEMSIFYASGRDSPLHLQGFSQTVGLGEGKEQSIHGGGNKQD